MARQDEGSAVELGGGLLGAVVRIGAARTTAEALDALLRAALLLAPGAQVAAALHGPDGALREAAAADLSTDATAVLARLRAHPDAVVLPVPVEGRAPGVLVVEGLPAAEIEPLRLLAVAAGAAITTAHALERAELQRRWSEGSASLVAAMARSAGRGDDELHQVARRVRELAGADAALLLLPSGPSEVVVEVAAVAPGLDPAALAGARLPRAATLAGAVLEEGEALVVDAAPEAAAVRGDLTAPPGWPGGGPTLLVPLGGADDVRGVLALVRSAPAFTELELSLAKGFAGLAALALQRSRAQADRGAHAVLEDRDRIARDLHDLVIQRLFATGLQLQGVARRADGPLRERVEGAVDDLDQTIRDIRTTIFQLHRRPDSTDLRGQLHDVADEAARPLGFPVLLELRGPISEAVPDELAPHLVAVLRESLSNVAKHAQASAVTVTVTADRDITLTVEDDGRGFVADRAGSGMRNMRRRAEMHGGRLDVAARPGGGTRLQWHVPA